jgi:seryl-tRNA synthetase
MLDIKLIRENPDTVRKDLEKRHQPEKLALLDELLKRDEEWRRLLTEVNNLRHRHNVVTAQVAEKKKRGEAASKEILEAKEIPAKIKELEEKVEKDKARINQILLSLPNILHESVPLGKDETENVVLRVWGKPPKFDFQPKNHLEIALNLDLIDEERAGKVAGRGFVYLKNELVLLDYAIMRYAMDFLIKKGYVLVEPPFMIRREPYEGVVDLADFENVMYKIENEDLYLIATSEHAMASMYMDEVINMKDLPIKLIGVSPCFRKEIGAHGKYTKGLFRMHQFNKVEQFIFCHPEQSWELFEEIQRNAEELYQGLGLHHRVIEICSGDMGLIKAKSYDTEVWMADRQFREIGSNSNCTNYQARRLNIRFREKEGQAPAGFVHTSNNTALATSRTMMAIVEQYQQKDGTVVIPKVLRSCMNKKEKIE